MSRPKWQKTQPRFTDSDRVDFLARLDNSSEIDVTDWEASFIESNLKSCDFSSAQRTVIDRMIDKYRGKLKW